VLVAPATSVGSSDDGVAADDDGAGVAESEDPKGTGWCADSVRDAVVPLGFVAAVVGSTSAAAHAAVQTAAQHASRAAAALAGAPARRVCSRFTTPGRAA
jgi:hypothetical protein